MKHFYFEQTGGLLSNNLPEDVLHRCEKINTRVFDDEATGSAYVADIVVKAIKGHNASKGLFGLGLSTGNTPLQLYRLLVQRFESGTVSFKNVKVFSIDEFFPLEKNDSRCRNYKIYEDFIKKVDILPENVHIINGHQDLDKVSSYCTEYDKQAAEIDLTVLGIGPQGQIGFNDAGTHTKTKTRLVRLTYNNLIFQTSRFTDPNDIPKMAITMGIGTLMRSKKLLLMAWGEEKADVVRKIVEEVPDTSIPASYFQNHPDVEMVVDKDAAGELTIEKTPWLVGDCNWTPKFIRKAVTWLSETVGKSILELSLEDYLENSLSSLLDYTGKEYSKINIDVFNDIQHTISGWPGGKPNADDTYRPVPAYPFPKKVIIFSPHPDDDVISMGGTFRRLIDNGHDVHVAYETSGNVAVHDDVVLQNIDTSRELGFGDRYEEVKAIIASKKRNEPEPRALLDIKGSIRRAEARAAVRELGLNDRTNAHFLNLPFYETGGIKKGKITEADYKIVMDLLQEIKPNQIYAAGDFYDPHGTHKKCTNIILESMERLWNEEWVKKCEIWLYRGAWKEWSFAEEDMAVPLSPEEMIKKRHAIYKHLSQKDIMPFPGADKREFWQRAEERTQNTARALDSLGLAKYRAMELFVKMKKR